MTDINRRSFLKALFGTLAVAPLAAQAAPATKKAPAPLPKKKAASSAKNLAAEMLRIGINVNGYDTFHSLNRICVVHIVTDSDRSQVGRDGFIQLPLPDNCI